MIDEVKDSLWTVVLVCRNVGHLSAIDKGGRDVVEDQGWGMNVVQSNRPSARYVTSFLRDRVRLVGLIYHLLLSPCFSSNQVARPQISPSGLLEIPHRYSELVRGFSHALSPAAYQQVPSESGFKLAPLSLALGLGYGCNLPRGEACSGRFPLDFTCLSSGEHEFTKVYDNSSMRAYNSKLSLLHTNHRRFQVPAMTRLSSSYNHINGTMSVAQI